MPQNPRKHKTPHARRIQILDDDGWTRISSTTASTARSNPPDVEDRLAPAEIPDGLTFEKLKQKYDWHKQRWLGSGSWEALKQVLDGKIARSSKKIGSCVCFGLGSPSGLLLGGRVDRRGISMFQLAAFESILELMSQTGTLDLKACYAQDPVFNDMDTQLLESIGLKILKDPDAFSKITKETFLYAPGAEKTHLMQLLSEDPALFFGSPLNDIRATSTEEHLCKEFIEHRGSLAIPEFEPNSIAFWGTALYWKIETPIDQLCVK